MQNKVKILSIFSIIFLVLLSGLVLAVVPIYTIGSIPSPQTVDEGSLLNFFINATGPTLTYSALNSPQGASLNILTGEFKWTPGYTQSGNYVVRFSATNSGGTVIATQDVTITVNDNAPQYYSIQQVEVNGIAVQENSNAIDVKREDRLNINVELLGAANSPVSAIDAEVEAWITGYEYGKVDDSSGLFEIQPGVLYTKDLVLEIPEDIEASRTAILHVQVSSDYFSIHKEYSIRLEEMRHNLDVYDIIFRTSTGSESTQEAGKSLFATVRVENLGAKKEEDIEVRISIPELGLMARDYIDELTIEDDPDYDEEDSMSSNELLLRIPSNAKEGTYKVIVEVIYNRGHSVIETSSFINIIKGVPVEPVAEEAQGIINVDKQIQSVGQGEGVAYKLTFINLAKRSVPYSLSISGTQAWAGVTVTPSLLTVQPDSTGEMILYLVANENAVPGEHSFVVNVLADTTTVETINLRANVIKSSPVSGWSNAKQGLLIAFLVLVVLLIILGLILIFTRLRREESEEEPSIAEGQNYYYYPNR